MTPKEAEEARARSALQGSAAQVVAYGDQHPDDFGGTYIDQKGGGIIVTGFTKDLELHRRQLSTIFPMPERLRFQSVRWSNKQLNSASDEIFDAFPSGSGVLLSRVGADPVREHRLIV